MYKEKLIDLLKSDKKVKEAMEKFEFGTKIILKNYIWEKTINQLVDWIIYFRVCWMINKDISINDIEKIIWLPLQERFIRMYCEDKWIYISIETNIFYFLDVCDWEIKAIKMDNSKDFNNQSEEFYKDIYEKLYNLNK